MTSNRYVTDDKIWARINALAGTSDLYLVLAEMFDRLTVLERASTPSSTADEGRGVRSLLNEYDAIRLTFFWFLNDCQDFELDGRVYSAVEVEQAVNDAFQPHREPIEEQEAPAAADDPADCEVDYGGLVGRCSWRKSEHYPSLTARALHEYQPPAQPEVREQEARPSGTEYARPKCDKCDVEADFTGGIADANLCRDHWLEPFGQGKFAQDEREQEAEQATAAREFVRHVLENPADKEALEQAGAQYRAKPALSIRSSGELVHVLTPEQMHRLETASAALAVRAETAERSLARTQPQIHLLEKAVLAEHAARETAEQENVRLRTQLAQLRGKFVMVHAWADETINRGDSRKYRLAEIQRITRSAFPAGASSETTGELKP